MANATDIGRGLRTIDTVLRAATHPGAAPGPSDPIRSVPFVTVSRQAGAGGRSWAATLVDRLNAVDPDPEQPWTLWDGESIDRVAADTGLSASLVEAVTDAAGRQWWERVISDLLAAARPHAPDHLSVYRRVASTIRAVCQIGRVVVVGRGGMCITRDLPGGVHVRLVAAAAARVDETANHYNLSPAEAAEHVRRTDQAREQFYRHYWPDMSLGPESFTVTVNTAAVVEDRLTACVVPLVVGTSPALAAI